MKHNLNVRPHKHLSNDQMFVTGSNMQSKE